MSIKYKMVGGWYFDSAYNAFWIKIGAGAWVRNPFSATVGAPNYLYAVGDGLLSDCIRNFDDSLNLAIALYPSVVYSAATVDMLTTNSLANGLIKMTYNDGDSLGALSIAFSDPASPLTGDNTYNLHYILRMTTSITGQIVIPGGGAGSVTSSRVAGYSLYPTVYLMSDLDEYEAKVMQALPDSGMPQTVLTSLRTKHRIGIRLVKAYPRSIVSTEYDQFVDFMKQAATGRPFRLYPDTTKLAAYEPLVHPFGYSTYVLDKESASWAPTPAEGNWYGVMDSSFLAWEV